MKSFGDRTSQDRSKRLEVPVSSQARTELKTCDFRIYKGIVNYTAKQGYRTDLRAEAVARASALRQSQQPKKDVPQKKLRGTKARKAAEKESS